MVLLSLQILTHAALACKTRAHFERYGQGITKSTTCDPRRGAPGVRFSPLPPPPSISFRRRECFYFISKFQSFRQGGVRLSWTRTRTVPVRQGVKRLLGRRGVFAWKFRARSLFQCFLSGPPSSPDKNIRLRVRPNVFVHMPATHLAGAAVECDMFVARRAAVADSGRC